MKAIIWTAYGPPHVLQLKEIETPTPKANEILIKIFATTVTSGDCEQRSLKLPVWYRVPMQMYMGLRRPERITILGMDFAGEVESAGVDVKRFKEGDQVFGSSGIRFGANAEYICLPEEPEGGALAIKPANLTYDEAAAVPVGGIEALCFLRQGNIRSGQKVLINGAGGTIGPYAVQIAKHLGAEVIAVDSTEKLDMLRRIGADQVVDYTQEDFTNRGETYDCILDVVSKSSFPDSIRSLNQNGCYLVTNPGLSQRMQALMSGKKVIFGEAHPKTEDLVFLKELIDAGKLIPVIDRRYPLDQTAEAHRYVEAGNKIGNVVITV